MSRRTLGTIQHPFTNGEFRSIQVFTSSGTWTKPSALVRVVVWVVGGGGGGGGAGVDTDAGSGGGGGGVTMEILENSALGATETITIGAAGSAGAAGDNDGTAGGTSSFGSLNSATGGGLGQKGSTGTLFAGGAGGVGADGTVNWTSQKGGSGSSAIAETDESPHLITNAGGSSAMGFGAGGQARGVNTAGDAGVLYGGGGAGGTRLATTDRAGGGGAAGIIIVEEYF